MEKNVEDEETTLLLAMEDALQHGGTRRAGKKDEDKKDEDNKEEDQMFTAFGCGGSIIKTCGRSSAAGSSPSSTRTIPLEVIFLGSDTIGGCPCRETFALLCFTS